MLHLSDVRVFLEIVAAGSLTGASGNLAVPKSSVARQLVRLETHLGRRLFARTSRVVALTGEGEAFLPYARRLLDDAREAENVVAPGAGGGAHGLLLVSASTTFGQLFLAPHLPDFRRRHPDVRVSLRLSPDKVEVGTTSGQVDVALRLGPLVDASLSARKLGEIGFELVATPAYLAERPPICAPADLARHELIHLPPRAVNHRLDLYRRGEHQAISYIPGIEINDPTAVTSAALAHGGVAVAPAFAVEAALTAGSLVSVLPDWRPAPTPVNVVFQTRGTLGLRVRAYLDFLFETIGRDQPWRSGARPPGGA